MTIAKELSMKVLGKAVGGFSMAPTEGMYSLVTLNGNAPALRELEAFVKKGQSSCKDAIDENRRAGV
ncbi:hypothetical protein [Brevibacillus agri]|nr:hypothetical protein [Brevibacillus agri]MED3500270.1 hypothetical protein [Brevibacillus agri]